jgi:hypothetical protein
MSGSEFSPLIEIDEGTRLVRIHRIFPDGRKHLFTERPLPLRTVDTECAHMLSSPGCLEKVSSWTRPQRGGFWALEEQRRVNYQLCSSRSAVKSMGRRFGIDAFRFIDSRIAERMVAMT